MDIQLQKLTDILSQLRFESMQSNESNIKILMDKYTLVFMGDKFNHIISPMLLNTLRTKLNIQFTENEFNELIPIACNSLNMKFEPLIEYGALPNSNISGYTIILW